MEGSLTISVLSFVHLNQHTDIQLKCDAIRIPNCTTNTHSLGRAKALVVMSTSVAD